MQQAVKAAAPWHLWVVGIVSLLWNGFGGYDYIMSQTGNLAYLSQMEGSMGVTAKEAIAYFESFPLWVEFGWGLGVWGSIAGSILLLFRSRFALHAFVASLIGLLAAMPWQFANPLPGMTDSPVMAIMTVVITVIILFLAWYSRAMMRRGVLR